MYFYVDSFGQQQGPVAAGDLPRYGVTPQTLVWRQGMSRWQLAGSVAELSAYFAPPPTYTPPPMYAPPPPTNVPLKNKYMYLIPGGILCVVMLWDNGLWLFDWLRGMLWAKGLMLPDWLRLEYRYITLTYVFYLNLITIGILILALYYACHSKRKTMWYSFAVAFTVLARECWWIFVQRIEVAKQYNLNEIEIVYPPTFYLVIVSGIALLVVALLDIFGNGRNRLNGQTANSRRGNH